MKARESLGAYRLVERLGAGGFGEVWKAEGPEGVVALKIPTDPAFTVALKSEAAFLHAISHPNVVRTLAYHPGSDPPFLVLEYVPGESLRDRLDREGRLRPVEAIRIVREVLMALYAAHLGGVAHLDVKPGNVLLGPDCSVKLTDFGLGVAIRQAASSVLISFQRSAGVEARRVAGTYDYMAPEQRRGERGDSRTDIFACGVLLYEMLTGAASPLVLPLPGELSWLSHVIGKALETDPASRHLSAAKMAAALMDLGTVTAIPVHAEAPHPKAISLEGHRGWVCSVAWHHDGTRLATSSWDGTVRMWAAADGAPIAQLARHENVVRNVAFAPKGDFLATASWDGTARICEVEKRIFQELAGHDDFVYSVAFAPDGRRLVTASWDRTAKLWSVPSGKEVATLAGHTRCLIGAVFSHDGETVITASWDGTAALWDATDGRSRAILEGHSGPLTCAVAQPGGDTVATASRDGTVRLWGVREGEPRARLAGSGPAVLCAAWSPDGKWIAAGGFDRAARIWSAEGKGAATLAGHADAVLAIAFRPDGRVVATADRAGEVRLWSVPDGTPLASLPPHDGSVLAVAFSPDGKTLASASRDGTARLYPL